MTKPIKPIRLAWLLAIIYALIFWVLCFTGCAAMPAISKAAALAGGVTIYKKATESGPKAEFVLIKFESNHYLQTVTQPTGTK